MQEKISWVALPIIFGAIAVLGSNHYLRLRDQTRLPKEGPPTVRLYLTVDSFDGFSLKNLNNNPENTDTAPRKRKANLNTNSLKESYVLEKGQITITENSKVIWQSPTDWRIDGFVLGYSNNDGLIDINLSVWKAGNFGPSKPFWVKTNDMSVKTIFSSSTLMAIP